MIRLHIKSLMQLSLYMSLSHLKLDSKRGPIDIAVHGNVNYFGNYGLMKFNLNPATVKAIILFNNSLRPRDAYIGGQTNPQCSDNGLSPVQRQAIYLNQWWNIVYCTLRNKLQWNFNRNTNIFIQENVLETVVFETASILSRPQCAKSLEVEMR